MAHQDIITNEDLGIEVEPLLISSTGALATGKTNIKAKIRRRSDGFVFDWADSTFKTVGSVGQLLQTLTEVDATNFPGEYNTSFDTSAITNPTADETFIITVVEDGSALIANLPQTGEAHIDSAADAAILGKKAIVNRQELAPGSLANMVLYDDDGTTPLLTWDVKDKDNLGIAVPGGAPAKRLPA